jgi:hypothetical protein
MSDYHRPFAEQLAFFKQKTNLPTQRWDDIAHEAHDRAFIVAGAQGADLLADLNAAVLKSIESGTGINAFRKDFKALVAKNGWTGWTGEGSQAGEAWRTKVIYQTNMATSYAAGRYQQLSDPQLLSVLPYWRYKHSDSVLYPRPLHVAWNGLTLPPQHPFWQTHYPPNGWGCHCRVTAVSQRDYEQAVSQGKGPADAPDPGNAAGIDKGFAYAPGASVSDELRALVEGKVAKLPAPIGAALAEDAATVLNRPAFVEARTAKEAATWAVHNDMADFADYTGCKPEVANAFNRSLFNHLVEFPRLRESMKFVGTAQAQFARWREIEIERYIESCKQRNPALPGYDWRPIAEQQVKLPKVGNQWAQATQHKDVSGVGVNRKWASDVEAFKTSLSAGELARWHPEWCATIRSVADHEMGHMLDSLLDLAVDSDVIAAYKEARTQGIKQEVSEYAGKNIKEFIAECWAEALNNPAPRRFAQRVADILRTRYAARFA